MGRVVRAGSRETNKRAMDESHCGLGKRMMSTCIGVQRAGHCQEKSGKRKEEVHRPACVCPDRYSGRSFVVLLLWY